MLSNNKINLMVAQPIVKEFLLSNDLSDKRVGWVTKVMEYDVEIKVTKLVRGKGLCEQIYDGVTSDIEHKQEVVLTFQDEEQINVFASTIDQAQEMVHFLQTGECPKVLDRA